MATINATKTQVSRAGEVIVHTWPALTFSGLDIGNAVSLSAWGEKSFQVIGTLGASGAVLIEGSNDGTNWAPLSNRQGVNMSFTALGFNRSQDQPVYVRPRVTAGDGTTSLSVVVACHRTDLAEVG